MKSDRICRPVAYHVFSLGICSADLYEVQWTCGRRGVYSRGKDRSYNCSKVAESRNDTYESSAYSFATTFEDLWERQGFSPQVDMSL